MENEGVLKDFNDIYDLSEFIAFCEAVTQHGDLSLMNYDIDKGAYKIIQIYNSWFNP